MKLIALILMLFGCNANPPRPGEYEKGCDEKCTLADTEWDFSEDSPISGAPGQNSNPDNNVPGSDESNRERKTPPSVGGDSDPDAPDLPIAGTDEVSNSKEQGRSGAEYVVGKKIAEGLGALWSGMKGISESISNRSQNQRQKTRQRIQSKIDEAVGLYNKANNLVREVQSDFTEVTDIVSAIREQDTYVHYASVKDLTRPHATLHNRKIRSTLKAFALSEVDDQQALAGHNHGSYPEAIIIENAREYAEGVDSLLEESKDQIADYRERKLTVVISKGIMDVSEDAYKTGSMAEGDESLNLALNLLDLAASFTPGVGFVKDVYEAATGINSVTGETLSNLERGSAMIGAATLGFGSAFGKGLKTFKMFRTFFKRGATKAKALKRIEDFEDSADLAGDIASSARKSGLGADDMKPFTEQIGKVGRTPVKNTPDEIAAAYKAGKDSGNLSKRLSPIADYKDYVGFRRDHILNRHKAGVGKQGKTEFPADWDDNRIMHMISDVSKDPSAVRGQGAFGEYVIGYRDGLLIRVDHYPLNHPEHPGKISTAFPINTTPNR